MVRQPHPYKKNIHFCEFAKFVQDMVLKTFNLPESSLVEHLLSEREALTVVGSKTGRTIRSQKRGWARKIE